MDLTGEWLRGITRVGFVPGVRARARAALRDLLEELIAAARAEPFDPAAGDRIGAELVDLRMSAPPVIGITVRLLAERLPPLVEGDPVTVRARVLELLEHVTTGFVAAQRDAAVSAAEQMNRSEKIHWRRVQTDLQRRLLEDPVTGLPNQQQLRQHLAAPGAERRGLCLLSIDHFPELADSLGQDNADSLLVAIGQRLGQLAGLFLAHLGDDQFALVADDTTGPDDVIKVADQARRALHAPFPLGGHSLRVDVTAGIVEGPASGAHWLRDARLALGWARQGHHEHAVYDPCRAEADRRRHHLAAALPSALDNGEFLAYYQPLYRLTDRTVIGVEALARWQRPGGGPPLGPGDFITLAERTGLIRRLGRIMLEQACRQGAAWRRAGHDLLISVNLSPLQLSEPTLPADVADILHRAGLPAGNLQLEITESMALEQRYATLRQLTDLGVRLALDDFGTGYSSLATLSWLPVSNVKLAAEFMADAGGPAASEMLRHTIALCHSLGKTVTAEGIETAEQEDLLRALGCDHGQGYHFARPAPMLSWE
ncbi:putative bifunctional diguanylate cyclase/phosphodiesterase [Paractinoplanes globisporus]|uniref:Bifunctional diguanylate cyclase/phosphodiesterase n=1 Tax=Paractinoplanes globisporus TaxID=113565 RepID=A0ABW6WGA3_9ACTN|nr:bifunctional diguanylate cyclase/phosphodiesterase [Actinoplanes globisporus]